LREAVLGVKRDVMVAYPSPCADCAGSGAASGTKPVACARCRGQGQVAMNTGPFVFATTCSDCGGRGRVIQTPCVPCKGRGEVVQERTVKVSIPSGIDNGQAIRLGGLGEAGSNGGPAGNLLVTVEVAEDERFERQGDDLVTRLTLSFAQAALGADVEVSTIDDRKLKVTVAAGTQPGEMFVFEREGVPSLEGSGRGRLVAVADVKVPRELSSKQKKLLREFEKLSDDDS